MKKIIYAVLSLMPLLFFVGCSEDNDVVEPGIQIGAVEVIFSKESGDKEVTVTVDTNHEFEAVWANEGAAWGEVRKGDGKVTIYVNESTRQNSRTASVLISTIGDVARKVIKVHQNGTDVTLDVLPEFIKFHQLAGSKTFLVTTDAIEWSVSGANDWLTVSMDRAEFNEVIVTVTENMGDTDRSATLVVTAGSSKKEVAVTQSRALDLIMPYLIFDEAAKDPDIKDDIKEFEEARGSSFITGGRMGSISYRIPSKNFPEIVYNVAGGLYMIIQHPNNYEVLKSPQLRTLIEESGFKYYYDSAAGQWTYFWRERDRAELRIDHVQGEMQFFGYQNEPVDESQKEDLPTFTTMPKPYLNWISTKVEIEAWEAADGSTLLKQFPVNSGFDQFVYTTKYNNPRKEFERSHWIYTAEGGEPQYMQTMYMYKDWTLAYYKIPAPLNEFRLTREFKKLLEDSGYVEGGDDDGAHYYSETDNLKIYVKVVGYPVSAPEDTLVVIVKKGDFSI